MGFSTNFYEKHYEAFMRFVNKNSKNKKLAKVIKGIDFNLPITLAGIYSGFVIKAYYDYGRKSLKHSVLMPAVSFFLVSALKKTINTRRPYSKYNFTPMVKKKSVGHSMPSLHTFSAAIIAAAVSYYYPGFGVALWSSALITGLMRVLTGVHHIEDVVVAIVLAALIQLGADERTWMAVKAGLKNKKDSKKSVDK